MITFYIMLTSVFFFCADGILEMRKGQGHSTTALKGIGNFFTKPKDDDENIFSFNTKAIDLIYTTYVA